jgi:hypothetical protein
VVSKFNAMTDAIARFVDKAFTKSFYMSYGNVKKLIDDVKNTPEALNKQGVLGITREQFVNYSEDVTRNLEKIVDVVIDELFKLVIQQIEQAIAFYNNFLELQTRYRQETPEQRQAEKAWIEQQRLALMGVQSGVVAI